MRILIVITVLFFLTYVYLLIPEDRFVKMNSWFFPLYNGTMTQIRLQSAVDYFITRLVYVGFVWLLWYFVPDERAFLSIVLALFIGYAFEYTLSYNNPYAYFINGTLVKNKPEGKFVPLSYPLLMAILLIILTCIRGVKEWMKYQH